MDSLSTCNSNWNRSTSFPFLTSHELHRIIITQDIASMILHFLHFESLDVTYLKTHSISLMFQRWMDINTKKGDESLPLILRYDHTKLRHKPLSSARRSSIAYDVQQKNTRALSISFRTHPPNDISANHYLPPLVEWL